MGVTSPVFLWKITLGTSNNVLRITEAAGGAATDYTITAGTYDDIHAVASQVKTDLDANSVNGLTYTCTVGTTKGIITLSANGAFELHSSHANCDMAPVLGFDTGADTGSDTAHVSDYPHQNGFYFNADNFGPDLEQDTDWLSEGYAPAHVALDGTITRRPVGSQRFRRDIEIGMIPEDQTFQGDDTDRLQSLETLWEYIMGGNSRYIRFYEDKSAGSGGDYTECHWMQKGDQFAFEPKRLSPGVERWGIKMELRKKV